MMTIIWYIDSIKIFQLTVVEEFVVERILKAFPVSAVLIGS